MERIIHVEREVVVALEYVLGCEVSSSKRLDLLKGDHKGWSVGNRFECRLVLVDENGVAIENHVSGYDVRLLLNVLSQVALEDYLALPHVLFPLTQINTDISNMVPICLTRGSADWRRQHLI